MTLPSIPVLINQFSYFSVTTTVLTVPRTSYLTRLAKSDSSPCLWLYRLLEISSPTHPRVFLESIRKGHVSSSLMSDSSSQGCTLTAISTRDRKCFLSLLILPFILGMFLCIWDDAIGYVLAVRTPHVFDVDHGTSSSPKLHGGEVGGQDYFLLMIQIDDAGWVAISSKTTKSIMTLRDWMERLYCSLNHDLGKVQFLYKQMIDQNRYQFLSIWEALLRMSRYSLKDTH